jgi:RNA polymerase sigma-70 factor (ECF subfamily)
MNRAYHVPLVVFVVGYVRVVEVAEELVQDIMGRVWERRAVWEPQGSIGSYLYTAARNRAMNHVRHRKVVERVEAGVVDGDAAPGMGSAQATDERIAAAELSGALHRAIDRLPARCRQAFLLRWQRQLSLAETAKAMGVARKTVERHWTLALKTLRQHLRGIL